MVKTKDKQYQVLQGHAITEIFMHLLECSIPTLENHLAISYQVKHVLNQMTHNATPGKW